MTQASDFAETSRRASDIRLIASVSTAHFVSHFYFLVLPPLFDQVRTAYDVSYTKISLALAVLNIVSALLQTSAGVLVDRIDARNALIAGLLLGALGFAIAAAVDSYWVLIAMFGVIGIGNTVYHPADYALLSHRIAPERMSQAYSVHTFAGMLGSACAPVTVLFLENVFGWRGAFFGAACLGLAAAAFLFVQREPIRDTAIAKPRITRGGQTTSQLLTSPPIVLSFVFFMLLSCANGGLQNFAVVALGALHDTPAITANAALTGNLLLSAAGVLLGGWIAARTRHHGLVAMVGLGGSALLIALLGVINPSAFSLIALMALAGICSGAIMPSRDMLVRAVTPPGAFGKVFGFVTNGFNIAGIAAPLVFGALMDHGSPRAVFFLIAACSLAAVLTVVSSARQRTV